MTDIAYVNGEFVDWATATVSIHDRGYCFGDGVYEVICGYRGRLWGVERHWRRLERSLGELGIRRVDLDRLRADMLRAVELAGTDIPLVYLQVTRGVAPRHHDWDPESLSPAVMMTVREAHFPTPDELAQGAACLTTEDIRWRRCDIKSLNLLPNVMAKQKAHEAGCFEAVFVDPDGTVTEGSSTSLSIVRGGTIYSHPNGPRILPGITRQHVFELAEEAGLTVREQRFDLQTLRGADEAFLNGTTTGVMAVARLDGESVGDGQVGPVVRRLMELYDHAVATDNDAVRA